MKPSQDIYPVFEVNQVLSSSHLNESFSYLDEQERLTRANLIGIGIACGLEITLDETAGAVTISRGCGVTSEGYLIVEPEDVTLVAFKPYTPPTDPAYPPFLKADNTPYPLLELFPPEEPGTTALKDAPDTMKGKAVLLFLELKKEGLRNCSLNNCDDRGAQITVTVRRLLIGRTDLDSIIAEANKLPGVSSADVETALLARLALPDLRLPRFDVPNTGPATTREVLAAFDAVFTTGKVAANLREALTAAYKAYLPLLQKKYPADPFTVFTDRFAFLDSVPATTAQVRFLQYYYDFFADLLSAYYEFRGKGIEVMCACCPPDQLFPRHLMLGLLFPGDVLHPSIYRHHFLYSPAVGGCEESINDLVQLFDRLVQMIVAFTDQPPLPQPPATAPAALPVRITPSKLGCAPLSDKAIPYYYREDGTPPLYQLWSPKKTRENRANQNLSFRSDEYTPSAPPFITDALRYDLEPYNFLRVEGHLGQDYQKVLAALATLKSSYRLPIEIIALRTGAFDDNIAVDLSKDSCRFQDLESVYQTLKAELICFLCKEVRYFYELPFESAANTASKPLLPLLVQCAPDFMVQPHTLGRLFEDWLASQKGVIPDIDPNIIINFLNSQNVGQNNIIIFYIIIYISKLFDQLAPDLQHFLFPNFQKRYQDLVSVTEAIENEREQAAGSIEGNAALLKWEELDDRLEDIIFHCRFQAFKALEDEYISRIRQVKAKQFLSVFLRDNPGIQHKGGVPLGGTFIVVYHGKPSVGIKPGTGLSGGIDVFGPGIIGGGLNLAGLGGLSGRTGIFRESPLSAAAVSGIGAELRQGTVQPDTSALNEAFSRISANRNLVIDPDIRFVLGTLTGQVPEIRTFPPTGVADDIINTAVNELADGTVIADFYLPYLYCSECPPIQFILPKIPPSFTLKIGCTSANNQAEVTITPQGGLAPYSVKVDGQDFQPLTGALQLSAGEHGGEHIIVLRDAEATESAPQKIIVAPPLLLGTPTFNCVGGKNEYLASFQITGGTPPYTATHGTVTGNTFSSFTLPGDTDTEVTITDSSGCTATTKLNQSCKVVLDFTTKLGCTTQGQGTVQVIATGGQPPYQVQVGKAAPVPIEQPLSLKVGTFSLTVIDDADNRSPVHTVVIPPDLVLKETSFSCQGTTSYVSVIGIEGGTPPYLLNGNLIAGNSITTAPAASGSKVSVTVTDQNKCTASIDVQHTCVQPCDLPCNGDSIRCSYRLWLQPPQGASYEIYRQDSPITFRFNGQPITLPDTSNLLQFTAASLNSSFDQVLLAAIPKLNDVINSALVTALGDAGKNRITISSAVPTAAAPPFAIMQIEHFACETFDLEFSFSYAKPNPAFSLTVRYTNEVPGFNGMIMINRRLNNKETRVPAFDCATRNLCTHTDYSRLCQGPLPKPLFEATSTGSNTSVFKGSVENPAEVTVTAWVWDILLAQASEPFYEGQEVTAVLQQQRGPVRLTAITKDGCFGINERSIDIIL